MYETVARSTSPRGEVVVRRRDDETLELRVNGMFVMGTAENSTERRLAQAALRLTSDPRRVLVGGLGLGTTLRELLADPRIEQVVVAEVEPVVVDWMRDGTLPGADLLTDSRVSIHVDDVRRVVAATESRSVDAVLLDVDNGPDYLVYDANAPIYQIEFLRDCRRVLRERGALAVWSSTPSAQLAEAVTTVFGDCNSEKVPVDLQGRAEHYWLFTAASTRAIGSEP